MCHCEEERSDDEAIYAKLNIDCFAPFGRSQ